MRKFYVTRKAAITRFIISTVICIASSLFADNAEFRIFMLIMAAVIGILVFIYKLFWDGLDKGSFKAFYSRDNLKKRDIYMRYCTVFALYGVICTVALYALKNILCAVTVISAILMLIAESILFFRYNTKEV